MTHTVAINCVRTFSKQKTLFDQVAALDTQAG